MPREYERTIDGRALTLTIDTSDYPEFIIEGATDENGDEIELTKAQEFDLYMQLGADIASDMCSDATDYMEDR
jgi:hypothetical protein